VLRCNFCGKKYTSFAFIK